MNRSKLIAVLAVVLVLVGFFVGKGMGLFGPQNPREAARLQREAILKQDRKNLARPEATEEELRNALMRLAAAQDPLALDEALKRLSHSSPAMRGAVAFALGRFQDPRTTEPLKTLLQDPSVEVRRDAIRALGMRAGPERVGLLETLRSRKDMSPEERVALWEMLLRWDRDGKFKSEAVAELMGIARSGDPVLRAQATGLLATRVRGDARVVALLKERAQGAGEINDRVMALHHLVALKDAWVLENFRKLTVDSSQEELQIVGLQLIGRACPPNLWQILDQKMADARASQQIKQSALSALAGLGGSKALEALERWNREGKLADPALQAMVQSLEPRLEKLKLRASRCEPAPAPGQQAGR